MIMRPVSDGVLVHPGTTTYNTAHQPYTIEPRPPAVNKFKYEPTPFEGESEAHDKFKAWELEKRAPPAVIPIRPSLPFSGTPELVCSPWSDRASPMMGLTLA